MFSPLSFDSLWHPTHLRSLGLHSIPYYNYSRIELAAEIKKRIQPSKFLTLIKKFFLKYPALVDGQDAHSQLRLLSNNLNVHAYATRRQSSSSQNSRVYMIMEVLSAGAVDENSTADLEKKNRINNTLLNISMHLTFTEGYVVDEYADLHPFFLEGVYDPLAGDMHLIGCRKVSKFGNIVENDLDSLVEVKVQYPSETMKWLKTPSVEVIITSQRSEDDPLHFKPVNLKTYMIRYDNHRQDVAFRKIFEGVLRLLISLMAVGIIYSQILYMKANEEYTPYVSLNMISLLIFGSSAELINATEILFESKESTSMKSWPYQLDGEYRLLMGSVESITRLLVLAALFLSAWQFQKVLEARSRPNAYGSNKPKFVPCSKNVLQRNLRIQIGVSIIFWGAKEFEIVLRNGLHLMDAFVLPGLFVKDLVMQIIRCQDIFLIPQIFVNSLWKNQVRPLRKTHYFGLTLLRMILFLYDYIRDLVLDPFYGGDGAINQVGSDLFSITVIMATPIFMLILASVVHVQQSWNYLKPRNT